MGARDAIERCLRQYATFRGRAARPEFWWFALFVFLGNFVAGLLDALLLPGDTALFGGLFTIAIFLPALAVSVRRLHDIGRTGWWVLLHLIPVIGFIVMVYFYLLKGDGGTNPYGPPPPR